MHRFWGSIIEPTFEVLKPRNIVEIGCEDGKNTSNILQYCTANGSHLTVIDPYPLFDAETWMRRHPAALRVMRGRSVDVLPQLQLYDTVLIDGDHNWYTVYSELSYIEQHMLQHGTHVLVMLHDVGWPYTRRDMYHNPADIPEQYRKPYRCGGLTFNEEEPVEMRGLNASNYHAIQASSERNGVLTAIEDFLRRSRYVWRFVRIPGFHGLGILVPEHLLREHHALNQLLLSLTPSPALASHMEALATEHIATMLSAQRQTQRQEQETREEHASAMRKIDIIVPIHNAFRQTIRCVESILLRTGDIPHLIILIDDCSTDARIRPYLKSVVERHAHVRLIRHAENLGFVQTVNEGIAENAEHDIVLVNSDTEVTGTWLHRLRATAYESPDCASVIPLSNEASIYSIFREHMPHLMRRIGLEHLSQIIAEHSLKLRPEIPTSVGFCLFIKRDALNEIGTFDEAYGMGYGEENDWCMRARRAGYRHYLADDCLVYHEGHISMRHAGHLHENETTNPHNEGVLCKKYPEYRSIVESFLRKNQDLPKIRNHFNGVLIPILATGERHIAYLLHGNPFDTIGGTERHVRDLMAQEDTGYHRYAIFPQLEENRLVTAQYLDGLLHYDHFPLPEAWGEKALQRVLQHILHTYHIDLLHVHHCMHTSFSLIGTAKKLTIPVIFSIHDYYALSPEFNLLRRDGTYRGVPKDNEYYDEHLSLTYGMWRSSVRQFLCEVDRIVAPSCSALTIFDQVFGDIGGTRHIIEHGVDPLWIPQSEEHEGSISPVCFLGNIHRNAKGCQLTERIALALARRGQEVAFLGTEEDLWPHLQGQDGIHFHGFYQPDQLPEKLRQIHPRLVCLLSHWPETFSYTLSESWAAGIPAYVTDAGALGERMRRHGGGRIAPTDDPVLIAEDICSFLASEDYQKTLRRVQRLRLPTRNTMWQGYSALYEALLKEPPDLASATPTQ